MGERKVLNKYYPPDFDTIKLPKLPGGRPDQYVVRVMAPFTMRCLTCGNYVYKGKKFNARKEDAKGETYLGIQIYRFYIRCPECLSEITFKTDPENSDYAAEHGAMRTFQAERLAELEEQKEAEEKEEEEANNPMLALENRTAESRMEMDVLDALEEIKDWNARNSAVKHEHLLEGLISAENKVLEEREETLTGLASKVFAEKRERIRRLCDDTDEEAPPTKQPRVNTGAQPTLNTRKMKLEKLVVRKKDKVKEKVSKNEATAKVDEHSSPVADEATASGDSVVSKATTSGDSVVSKGGLGLLCRYSDSSGDSD